MEDKKRRDTLTVPSGRRRKDVETEAKMRLLWGILLVLVVILIAAIVYEIVLGNGTKETGNQRMGQSIETEMKSEIETEIETEKTLTNPEDQEGVEEEASKDDANEELDEDAEEAVNESLDDATASVGAGEESVSADTKSGIAVAQTTQQVTLAGLGE